MFKKLRMEGFQWTPSKWGKMMQTKFYVIIRLNMESTCIEVILCVWFYIFFSLKVLVFTAAAAIIYGSGTIATVNGLGISSFGRSSDQSFFGNLIQNIKVFHFYYWIFSRYVIRIFKIEGFPTFWVGLSLFIRYNVKIKESI